VAQPVRSKVDVKAVWREAMGEIGKLRGAVPARYDQFAAISARLAAKAEGDAATADQLRRLGDLSDLLEKAERYLRIQLQSAKPRLNIKVGDKPQLMKVEDIDAENVYITTSSGRQPRPRIAALDLEDELWRNLENHPIDRRADDRRCYAAFVWYWKPDEARDALAKLGADDALARALASLEQNGRLLDVAAAVARQGDALVVSYDFTRKDGAMLVDFEGEGASYGENGLLWKSARAMPAPVEAELPTLRWRGRLRPPLTVSALAVVPSDTQLAMIGVLAGDRGARIGLTGRNFPRIECTALAGDEAGKLKLLPGEKLAFSFAAKLQLDLAVAADGKTTLSVNGKPVARDPVSVAAGSPLAIALQAFQSQDGKQSGIELLTLTISGRPAD
jgi:hypothetical protein